MSADDVFSMLDSINNVAAQGLRSGFEAGRAEIERLRKERDEAIGILGELADASEDLMFTDIEMPDHDDKCRVFDEKFWNAQDFLAKHRESERG